MRFLVLTLLILTVGTSESRAQTDTASWVSQFVNRLDPQSTPARQIEDLGPAATEAQVIAVAAAWFRSQPVLQPLWVMPFPEHRDPTYRDPQADNAVNHLITTRAGEEQYGDTLPWFDPDKQLTTLARFPHFDYLAPAYFHTGDERYARTMVRDMMDFIEHVPLSKSAGYHVQMNLTSNPWNWVLLQWRVKRWIDALGYLRSSPSVSDAQYLRIMLHIWEEIEWLGPRKVLGLHNGTLGNLSAILYTALHFPEAAQADAWLQDAGSFFSAFLDTAFYPGEFLVELTIGYSEGTLVMCLSMFESLPPSALRDEIAPKLEKLVEAHVGLMKPDRSLPRYGDHGAYDIRARLLRKAGALFDRSDFLALAETEDDPNVLPARQSFPFTSNPYYLSGYYAMRDGWDTEALYLSMDAGPFGTNHHHGDKLSITVSADGAAFIVDPGTSLYSSLKPGPRIDLRPGYLHNVITLDGVDPNTGWDRHYGFDVLENRWVTNRTYDFLEGIYEFKNNRLDASWRRSVFFLKGAYWILIDRLFGEGEHRVESNFQFMIDTEVDISAEVVGATAPNGARLSLYTVPEDGLTPHVVVGDTTFPGTTFLLQYPTFVDWTLGGRGWVGTFGNESKRNATQTHPAPAVVFEGTVSLPHTSVRVLSPSKQKVVTQREVTWLERSADRFRLQISESGSEVVDVLDWSMAAPAHPRAKLDDDAGYWYRSEAGQVRQIILMNTAAVEINTQDEGIKLVFETPFEGIVTRTETGWTLFVDAYLSAPVRLVAFDVMEKTAGAESQRFQVLDAEPDGSIQPGQSYRLTSY